MNLKSPFGHIGPNQAINNRRSRAELFIDIQKSFMDNERSLAKTFLVTIVTFFVQLSYSKKERICKKI